MSQCKIGRPGKKEQTRPMIYERARRRVTRQVSMSAKTAENLDRYVMWAAAEVGAEQDEALVLTVDQAMDQFFGDLLELIVRGADPDAFQVLPERALRLADAHAG